MDYAAVVCLGGGCESAASHAGEFESSIIAWEGLYVVSQLHVNTSNLHTHGRNVKARRVFHGSPPAVTVSTGATAGPGRALFLPGTFAEHASLHGRRCLRSVHTAPCDSEPRAFERGVNEHIAARVVERRVVFKSRRNPPPHATFSMLACTCSHTCPNHAFIDDEAWSAVELPSRRVTEKAVNGELR